MRDPFLDVYFQWRAHSRGYFPTSRILPSLLFFFSFLLAFFTVSPDGEYHFALLFVATLQIESVYNGGFNSGFMREFSPVNVCLSHMYGSLYIYMVPFKTRIVHGFGGGNLIFSGLSFSLFLSQAVYIHMKLKVGDMRPSKFRVFLIAIGCEPDANLKDLILRINTNARLIVNITAQCISVDGTNYFRNIPG